MLPLLIVLSAYSQTAVISMVVIIRFVKLDAHSSCCERTGALR